ncbi:MAG: nuclease [Novosphingobium sp.]|nr:nuclease [Novosphingobium sp.]
MPSTLAALVLCSVVVVHDGDTFRCNGEKIRIANIDAPELPDSPRCKDARRERAWCDYRAGYASRDALSAFLRSGQIKVHRQGVDRYGRTLATVTVNGKDVGSYLVQLKMARWWQ